MLKMRLTLHDDDKDIFSDEMKKVLEKDKEAIKMAISAMERDRWIPVTERLPEPEKEIDLTVERRDAYGKCRRFTVRAIYEDGSVDRYNSKYDWDDELDFDYDSETDTFFVPKGWFEAVTYIEHFQAIPDFDIAWRPMPEPFTESEGQDEE